ncbi:glutathione S-transferase family protein [uncultured Tateyamaria sp.]|uniref:glutathione S-transferase family protein n=1 Tax=uncultured Tateyamaria sp. TaxID=455651 RepID=UPI0026351F27|nr:glutathione S-transferase family protein [uncultured Tateyamaria sp.]
MLTLITYPPAFDQLSASPFCVKAMYLLNLSGMSWQRDDTPDPRNWPKGKLPALWVKDEIIGDSENIRAWLERNGAEFDKGLSDLDRAASRAFIRMAEEHLYFHILLDRWGDDRVWSIVRDTYFAAIPTLLRKIITRPMRRAVLHGMHSQGLGRLTEAERLDRVEPDLQAITDRLWQGPFLFGNQPTAADASVAPMLAAMAATPCDTALSMRMRSDEILTNYVQRVAEALG